MSSISLFRNAKTLVLPSDSSSNYLNHRAKHHFSSPPTAWGVIERRNAKSCLQYPFARTDTRTIAQECHINIPESKSVKCAAFAPTGMRNDS